MAWCSTHAEDYSTSVMGSTSPLRVNLSTGGVTFGMGGAAGLSANTSTVSVTTAATAPQKGASMMDEFKSYVREYKDWIFTIAIIAVIDHFFLDGALKEKLSAALGKKLDGQNDGKPA